MKIYQVVVCEGSWDDYGETVKGTFIDKSKAESLKQEIEEKRDEMIEDYGTCQLCDYDIPCFLSDLDADYPRCENEVMYDEFIDARVELREYEVIE